MSVKKKKWHKHKKHAVQVKLGKSEYRAKVNLFQ